MSIPLRKDFDEQVIADFHILELSTTSEIEAFIKLLDFNSQWAQKIAFLRDGEEIEKTFILFREKEHWQDCTQKMPFMIKRMEAEADKKREAIMTGIYSKSLEWQRVCHLR